MLMKLCIFIISLVVYNFNYAQIYQVVDSDTKKPISFATVSFGNGNGLFANENGYFKFSEKWYSDIDSLFISAIGHKELKVATKTMPSSLALIQDVAELTEVLVLAENKRKYKVKKITSKIHNDYFKCWLPTVESEIGVFFEKNVKDAPVKIASVFLPVKFENAVQKRGKIQSFSTLFKMQFYNNKDGYPDKRLPYEDIIFVIDHNDKANFELDISDYKVYIPDDGIFIGIQVLGYTDPNGELQLTKKYSEIETPKGIVKISTTFRPLLPFHNQSSEYKTFTRRVFFKNKEWQRFDSKYSKNNKLIKANHTNYGMGLKLHIYKE